LRAANTASARVRTDMTGQYRLRCHSASQKGESGVSQTKKRQGARGRFCDVMSDVRRAQTCGRIVPSECWLKTEGVFAVKTCRVRKGREARAGGEVREER
jgi:hypothetical protein